MQREESISGRNLAEVNKLTETIIGCAMKVSTTLGAGFLEKVYENALAIELRKTGLELEQQKPISVFYDGEIVGSFVADMLVSEYVLLELKAARTIEESH